jgi:ATP-dependent protease HslVU (ClpYQ) peptidase subunit
MTICVAGLFMDQHGPAIVAAADMKVSWQYDSIEGALKIRRLNECWFLGISTNNLSSFTPILDDLRKNMRDKRELSDVVKAAQSIYKKRDETEAWQFLLAGFDTSNAPHLVVIESRTNYADTVGFAAVGSGSLIAESVLRAYPYQRSMALSEAIYCIATAKFSAERAEGIGPKTVISVLRPNQTCIDPTAVPMIDDYLVDWIRKEWESLPRIPNGLIDGVEIYLAAKRNFLS